MNSVQERLKLKRVPIDTWSVKEKLCLASAVLRSGDQNWMSVSRALRMFGEPGRPVDWFSQKSCALQYGNLLENVDTPKRKKRTDKSGSEHVETPGEAIVRNLTHERINELKKLLQEERTSYLKLKEEVAQIKAGQVDDKLGDMCQQVEVEEKQKERDAETHKRWLQERQEKKIELERAWKPPVTPASPHRKKIQRGPGGNRRNSSQSEPSSEADSAVDSPLSEPLNVDVIGDEATEPPPETKPVVPTPTSPLLTSLLKSPSPAPSAQSSILHSAITAHHRSSVASSSPTIASLLHSSPGIPATSVAPPPPTVSPSLKNLVTSAISAAVSEEGPKPSSTSPAAGAPTLSMLLELPPSLPGKPLPELPVSSVAKPPSTNKAGEVCHPQHQEMRVRRELGTDEPVEVVEVEQQVTIPNLRDQLVQMEVVVGPQDLATIKTCEPQLQSSLDEDLKDVSEAIARVEKEELEEQLKRKALAEARPVLEVPPVVVEPEDKKTTAEELLDEVKMIMDMPIVVEDSAPEPQAVAEVVEVPAQAADIIVVEEVPPEVVETKPEDSPPEVTVVSDTEGSTSSRIEVVAIEIPDDDAKETVKEEPEEEPAIVKEEEVKAEVIEEQKPEEEVKVEESVAEEKKEEVQEEVSEDKQEPEEQSEKEEAPVPVVEVETAAEEIEETKETAKETEEAAEKVGEVTEEEEEASPRVDSSDDEKKADETDQAEDQNNASTGGKTWKEDEEEEEIEEDKKEKGGTEDVKQPPDKTATAQKAATRAETPSTEDDKTNDALEPPRSNNRRRGATATPVDSVPNSPAAPITDEDREYRAWKKAIMLVYGRLATHKYASLFLRPITDDQAPGYSSVVHRPLDLLTIKKNIELGVTRTTSEFQRDVMLMFLNSIMYNKSSHFVHKMARQMQQEGMQHIQDFLTTQMLVQVVGEAPLRRETRTTEANKQRDLMTTPGSSSQDETEASTSQSSKRKRPEPDRSSTKKRKVTESE